MAKGVRGGKSATAVFDSKYDVSGLSNEEISTLAQGMVDDDTTYDYDFITIRNVEPKYAASLKPSNEWEDGRKTSTKLNGVSTLDTGINYNDSPEIVAQKLSKAIQKSVKTYGFGGRKPFIVLGTSAQGGNDDNELIVSDPKILDISKYIKK